MQINKWVRPILRSPLSTTQEWDISCPLTYTNILLYQLFHAEGRDQLLFQSVHPQMCFRLVAARHPADLQPHGVMLRIIAHANMLSSMKNLYKSRTPLELLSAGSSAVVWQVGGTRRSAGGSFQDLVESICPDTYIYIAIN